MNADDDDGNCKQNGTIPASLRFIRTVLSPRNRVDSPEDHIRFARKYPRNSISNDKEIDAESTNIFGMMGRVIR